MYPAYERMTARDQATHDRLYGPPARPNGVPTNARLLELPYSEVCMHMKIAGKTMWVEPVGSNAAQLYDEFGRPFSFPITKGEAGWVN